MKVISIFRGQREENERIVQRILAAIEAVNTINGNLQLAAQNPQISNLTPAPTAADEQPGGA